MRGETADNYSKMAEDARKLFTQYDQSPIIERFALVHDDETISIIFFGEEYSINRTDGRITRPDGERVSFDAVMTIYDALCSSKPEARIVGEWKPLSSLSPHSNFNTSSLGDRTAKRFEGRLEELKAACESLGGTAATNADAGYMFMAFSFMPVIFQFWDGDDEFPPRISCLFDSGALDYIHFETGWYVAGHLYNMISGAMDK